MNNLIKKLRWAIRESRKIGHPYISSSKLEEYIQEYQTEFPGVYNKNKNGEKYEKDNIVDFILDID